MSDLIDRQSVKEWLERWEGYLDKDMIARMQLKVDDIPTHQTPSNTLGALDCVSREDLTKGIEAYFDDLPIAVHYDMLALAQKLPFVQPEIIRCKDCKWWDKQEMSLQGRCGLFQMYPTGEWYCGNAKLRGEE